MFQLTEELIAKIRARITGEALAPTGVLESYDCSGACSSDCYLSCGESCTYSCDGTCDGSSSGSGGGGGW